MAKTRKPDFPRKLARPIEPTGGPELETLEDAVRFIGLLKPWRQARPYWDHCAGEILKAFRERQANGYRRGYPLSRGGVAKR
jgi:hypothetical protein